MATVFDNFDRANGAIGASYTNAADNAPQIVSNVVRAQNLNTFATGISTTTFGNDQSASLKITTFTGAVNTQAGISLRDDAASSSRNFYGFSIYRNSGGATSEIFKFVAGSFTSLITESATTWLAGDVLSAYASGTALVLLRNGEPLLSTTDSAHTSGKIGFYEIVATAGSLANLEVDNFFASDSTETFTIQLLATDANGVKQYYISSVYNAPGHTLMRVLAPVSPTAGVAHRIIYMPGVLPNTDTILDSPVEDYQDGIGLARVAALHDKFNGTLVCPTFRTFPWVADHPSDNNRRYESFYVLGLQPWAAANLGATGEEHWFTSFSKGGQAAIVLGMKWRSQFNRVGAWDQASDDSSGITGASFTGVHHPDFVYDNETYYNNNYSIDNNLATWETAAGGAFNSPPRHIWLSGDDAQFETYAAQQNGDLDGVGISHYFSVAAQPAVTHQWATSWIYRSFAGMAGLPNFTSTGTEGTGSGATVSPGAPATSIKNDVWICVIHNSGQGALTMDAAWTQLVQGNGGGTTSRLAVFYHRYDGSNTPTLTVTRAGGTGAQLQAAITCWRGCVTSNSPANSVGSITGGTDASMETSAITLPASKLSTLLVITGSADDNAVTIPTNYLAAFTESGPTNNYQGTAGTPDGMVSMLYGFFGGGSINPTITQAASDAWATVLISLEPEEIGIYRRRPIYQAVKRAAFF